MKLINKDGKHSVKIKCGERVSQGKPLMGSSSDETESCNPPGQLIFEYFEHETPYNREPLANKARCVILCWT